MEIDEDKIDAAALALLSIKVDQYGRAWKQLDWDVLNRLHEKGYISNPINKNKSIVFTEEGATKAEEQFKLLFSKD